MPPPFKPPELVVPVRYKPRDRRLHRRLASIRRSVPENCIRRFPSSSILQATTETRIVRGGAAGIRCAIEMHVTTIKSRAGYQDSRHRFLLP